MSKSFTAAATLILRDEVLFRDRSSLLFRFPIWIRIVRFPRFCFILLLVFCCERGRVEDGDNDEEAVVEVGLAWLC